MSKFHKAFDANKRLLLPKPGSSTPAITHQLPNIDADIYKYTLVAHEDVWNTDTDNSPLHLILCDLPPAKDCTYYPHPYHDFPDHRIAYPSLLCYMQQWQRGYEMNKDDLAKLQAIWNSWRHVVPMEEFIKTTSRARDPGIKDDKSDKTTPHRARRCTRPKRKATGEQDSPTSKSSKQRRVLGSGCVLTIPIHFCAPGLLLHDPEQL
ncbi:hypothetical protein BYT27DRAFT_7251425 [Phlegmacium glaucopus]|nr:hypothetical protein BYT27DRAFT_7251425 [Phlegmacium glaucopus]